MSKQTNKTQEKLNLTGCEFDKILSQKLAEIEQLLNLTIHGKYHFHYLDEMHRLVHSLMGASNTLGFFSVSAKAKDLVDTLNSTIKDQKIDKRLFDKVWSHLISLRNAAKREIDPKLKTQSNTLSAETELTSDINLAPLNILLASDDELFCDWLYTALSYDEHKVTIFNNGYDCVKEIKSRSYDAILLEVMMPRMNGYETAKQIKHHNMENFLPIIFVTALDHKNSLIKCIQAGGDDVITKPLSLETLKAKLFAFERIKSQYL